MKTTILLAAMLGISLVACAADSTNDDADATEADLTGGGCEIGTSCPTSLKLLEAKNWGTSAPAKFRSDVSVEGKTPRIVRQLTSRAMTFKGGFTMKLRSFEVDDFLLVEVLDAKTGAFIDAGFVSIPDGNPTVGGVNAKLLGGRTEASAGTVDLSMILPHDRAFRLRVAALDLGGTALVGDIVADIARDAGATNPVAGQCPDNVAMTSADVDATVGTWKSAMPFPGACTQADIDRLTANLDRPNKTSFVDVVDGLNPRCAPCVLSYDTDASWQPVVATKADQGKTGFINWGACYAGVEGAACGRAISDEMFCYNVACNACSTPEERQTCTNTARAAGGMCKGFADKTDAACPNRATTDAICNSITGAVKHFCL